MKRKILSSFLALVLFLSLAGPVWAASANDTFLIDEADLLTSAEEAAVIQKLQTISREYNAQIIVAALDSLQGWHIDAYIEHAYDTSGFGYGANHDGVFLLVSMSTREYRILSNGFAGDAIGMDEIDAISEEIVSDLSAGFYADAFEIFANQCAYYLDGHLNGFPFDFGGNLVIALIIGLVAGLIVAFVLKGQLKSVRRQHQANVYVRPGSMQLTQHSDIYLYRNVSRVKKQTSSSSGSRSGGSRHVGGGSF